MASWNLISLYPENCLEQLEMGFPRGAQPAPLLCSILKASGSLQQLSLDSATFASPQDFGIVLQTLKGKNQLEWSREESRRGARILRTSY